jgi:hypothetical protein
MKGNGNETEKLHPVGAPRLVRIFGFSSPCGYSVSIHDLGSDSSFIIPVLTSLLFFPVVQPQVASN